MRSNALPTIEDAKNRYELAFSEYSVLMFHPVTSERNDLKRQIRVTVDEVISSDLNYIVVYPNNDPGTENILNEYSRLLQLPRFRLYPSLRFEYFLTLLKHARFVIGNSSAGVREAPHFGVPAINLGSRQNNRVKSEGVIDVTEIESVNIKRAIDQAGRMPREPLSLFGDGNSAERFHVIVSGNSFWNQRTQKFFVDRHAGPISGALQQREIG
jgi:UDP-N-acetylglucosamine 2-epimerase (hydrolysing)